MPLTPTRQNLVTGFKTFSKVTSTLSILIGSLVLIGWWLNIPLLKSGYPGIVSMASNTAFCFILAGVALWLLNKDSPNPRSLLIANLLAGIIIFIGLLTLGEYLFGWDLGINQLLYNEPTQNISISNSNRMVFLTAVNFILLGFALLTLDKKIFRKYRISVFLAFLIISVAMIGFFDFILVHQIPYTKMAFSTASIFLIVSLGLLFIRPEQGVMSIFVSDGIAGILVREITPTAIVLIMIVNSVGWKIAQWNLLPGWFDNAVMVLINTLLLLVIFLWTAKTLDKTDKERKNAEEVLRENENKFRTLIENVPLSIFLKNKDSVYISINNKYARDLGILPDEVVGKTDYDFFPKEFAEKYRADDKKIMESGETVNFDEEYINKEGRQWINTTKTPIKNQQGQTMGILGVLVDITKSKQAEEKLRNSEVRYRRLFESAKDGILILDAVTGQIIDSNPFLENLLGFSHTELLGKELGDIGFFKDILESKISFKELQTKQYIRHEDLLLETKDGRKINVEFVSNVYDVDHIKVIQCNFRDITERKKAEKEITLLSHSLQSINECISITDTQNNFIYVNDTFLKTYQYERNELIGKNTNMLGLGETPAKMDEILQATLQGGWQGELFNKKKDGTEFPIFLSTSVIHDDNHQPIALIGVAMDITERKQAEKTMREQDIIYREAITQAGAIPYKRDYLTEDITFLGQGIKELTGYSAEEITTKIWKELIQEVIMRGMNAGLSEEEAVQRVRSGKVSNWEADLRIKTRSGETCWVSDSSVQLLDTQGKSMGTLGILQDITERKQSEEVLQESEKRYRSLFENMIEGYAFCRVIHENNQPVDFIHINANDEFKKITGFSNIRGKRISELIPDIRESQPQMFEIIGRVLSTGKSEKFEQYIKPLGIWLSNSIYRSEKDCFVLIIENITERKQAEKVRDVLESLGKQLNEINTPKEVAKVVLDIADNLFGWDACVVELFREDTQSIESILLMDTIDGLRKEYPSTIPPGTKTPILEHILKEGASLILRDKSELQNESYLFSFGMESRKSASLMYVPIRKQMKNIGLLSIQSYTPNAYTQKDLDLLQILSDHCSGALERTFSRRDLEIQLQHISALRNIDQAIAGSLDVRITLNVILDQVVQQLHVDACDILLLRPNTQTLQFTAGRGFTSKVLQHTDLRLGEGYAGTAALQNKLIHIPNIKEKIGSLQRATLLESERFISYYAIPLSAKGQVKGVLEIFHRKSFNPTSEWLDFLHTLAGQAAIAIDEAELFENLQKSNIELFLSYDTTIEGWSKALDLRDKETEGHTQRVTELTLKLAREMGITEEEIVHIRRGCLLHDIGKMGVPDSILLKPSSLTAEEWVIMKKHPVFAYNLLYPIAYLRPALDIPYCHHEKWDGSGYPHGLKEEQIPLSARIFAVIDVWDALRSDRPYRKAWDKEKTLEHIKAGSGSHFDPKVVDSFLKMKL